MTCQPVILMCQTPCHYLYFQGLSPEELVWLNSDHVPSNSDAPVVKRVRKDLRLLSSEEWAAYARVKATYNDKYLKHLSPKQPLCQSSIVLIWLLFTL